MYRSFVKKLPQKADENLKIYESFVDSFDWKRQNTRKAPLGLETIIFADTHGYFAVRSRFEDFIYEHPKYDVCLLLGDVAYEDIDMILQYVPDYKILSVLGNHDSTNLLKQFNLIDLDGRILEYKGLKFAGLGGSHRYKCGNWPMLTQSESLEQCLDMIESYEPADILITHDKAFIKAEYDVAHTGLVGITTYVDAANPIYHLHGHQHINSTNCYKNGTIEKCVYGGKYMII